MTLHTGTQTITINMLSDISRSKNNHTIKFGQLIEYNVRNIFLEKQCTKCGGETSPHLFLKNQKLSISPDQHPEVVSYSLFLSYVQVEDYQNMLKLSY